MTGDSAARDYGSVVPFWDMLFGTFIYQPHRIPDEMGLTDPASYPDPRRFHLVLSYPFRAASPRVTA